MEKNAIFALFINKNKKKCENICRYQKMSLPLHRNYKAMLP